MEGVHFDFGDVSTMTMVIWGVLAHLKGPTLPYISPHVKNLSEENFPLTYANSPPQIGKMNGFSIHSCRHLMLL